MSRNYLFSHFSQQHRFSDRTRELNIVTNGPNYLDQDFEGNSALSPSAASRGKEEKQNTSSNFEEMCPWYINRL